MTNKLLIAFIRDDQVDLGEKLGNIGLGLLRTGFGKTFIVERISDKNAFRKKVFSISARVGVVALFILMLPLTITLAGVGCIGISFSKSYEQIFHSYRVRKTLNTVEEKTKAAQTLSIGQIVDRAWSTLEHKTHKALHEIPVEKLFYSRFENIGCPLDTIVKVEVEQNNVCSIHASYIGEGISQRHFVASEAPLLEHFSKFWKAFFDNNARIIDLTNNKDNIPPYCPEKDDRFYKPISVSLESEENEICNYKVQEFTSKKTKTIKRYHYSKWPDFGVISIEDLKKLIKQVQSLAPDKKDLLWIHCRAGVGRTGTLITAIILKEKIESGEINKKNLDESLVNLIFELRKQRGSFFVQKKEQLKLLFDYAHSLIGE